MVAPGVMLDEKVRLYCSGVWSTLKILVVFLLGLEEQKQTLSLLNVEDWQ
jgi:hypothetical protein